MPVIEERKVMDVIVRIHALVDIIERAVPHKTELFVAGCPEEASVRRSHRHNDTRAASCAMSYESDISRLLEYTRNEIAA